MILRARDLPAVLVLGVAWNVAAQAGEARTYGGRSWSLTLDGASCGVAKSVEGGAIAGKVTTVKAGTALAKKQLGGIEYEPVTLQVSLPGASALQAWISDTWASGPARHTLGVVAVDRNLQPVSERQFADALITETIFPALDGASKEPGYLTVTVAPSSIRNVKPGGAADTDSTAKQKVFLAMNFRLELSGLDCSKVSRIDPIIVKRKAATEQVGELRVPAKEGGDVEFSDLKITVAESAAQPFLDWHQAFVVEGKNDDANEKNGAIIFLGQDRSEELARVDLFNVGVHRVTPAPDRGSDSVSRVVVEMYVERMALRSGKGEAPTPAAKPGLDSKVLPTPPRIPRPRG